MYIKCRDSLVLDAHSSILPLLGVMLMHWSIPVSVNKNCRSDRDGAIPLRANVIIVKTLIHNQNAQHWGVGSLLRQDNGLLSIWFMGDWSSLSPCSIIQCLEAGITAGLAELGCVTGFSSMLSNPFCRHSFLQVPQGHPETDLKLSCALGMELH